MAYVFVRTNVIFDQVHKTTDTNMFANNIYIEQTKITRHCYFNYNMYILRARRHITYDVLISYRNGIYKNVQYICLEFGEYILRLFLSKVPNRTQIHSDLYVHWWRTYFKTIQLMKFLPIYTMSLLFSAPFYCKLKVPTSYVGIDLYNSKTIKYDTIL